MANTCDIPAFKARFPEFNAIDDARIQVFADDALLVIKEATWGATYSLALCYLTAHYLTLGEKSSAGNSGNVGSVASRGVDGVSVSYNSQTITTDDQAYFNSTIYGQRFMAMIRSLGTMAFNV